jgi:hypothetical protein
MSVYLDGGTRDGELHDDHDAVGGKLIAYQQVYQRTDEGIPIFQFDEEQTRKRRENLKPSDSSQLLGKGRKIKIYLLGGDCDHLENVLKDAGDEYTKGDLVFKRTTEHISIYRFDEVETRKRQEKKLKPLKSYSTHG